MATSLFLKFVCSILLAFGLQRQTSAQKSPPTSPPPACSSGWTQHGDYCYIVKGVTYADAKSWVYGPGECRNTGSGRRMRGNLVSIGSASEQTFVYSLLKSTAGISNIASVYIGLNARLTSGGYHWSDGSAVSYTHWENNFKTVTGKDCVAMKTSTGRWTDRECDELTAYICKQPKYGYTRPTQPPVVKDVYCQSGWTQSNGHCYQYVKAQSTYATAETACQSLGASVHLASIEDVFQQAIILYMLRHQGVDVWIGLDDQATEGVYKWTDQTPVTYSNWGPGEPNSQGRHVDCVDFDSATGLWNDRWCGQKRGYVCKTHPDQSTPPAVSTTCDKGWVSSDGHCYWFETGYNASKQLNYTDAQAFCRKQSGYLVHVNNKYENAFLTAQFLEKGGSDALQMWIGINDMATEGVYVSDDNWPIEFTSWRQGEPNDYRHSEDCTELYAREVDHLVNGLWNDRNCAATQGYICEKRTSASPTSAPTPEPHSSLSCANGWQRLNNWCYNFQNPLRLSWTDARARCRQYGADLISIHSTDELNFVVTQFQQKQYGTIWMGLNDRNIEGGYVWSDGSPVQFTNWNRGEPNNYYGQEDCAQIYGSKKWNDLACGRQIHFACKISIKKNPTVQAATIEPYYKYQCDSGWYSHGSYCYYFSYGAGTSKEQTWTDAQTYCQQHKANLTSVTSLDEEEFLANTILTTINNSDSTNRMWIGLSDNVKEGTFQWVDGSDFPFSYWNNGEPNNWRGDENCGEIVRGQYWNDNACTKTQPFICKKPRNGLTVHRPSLPTLSIWGTCPPGWMSLMDDPYCYQANATAVSWPEAEMFCAGLFPNQSSHLASIVSVRESTFITTKVLPRYKLWGGNRNVWIGLNDRVIEHTYVWTDGLPVLITSWWRNQPNDYDGTQNCVYLNSAQGRWNDLGCQNKRPFVCKMKKYPGSPPPFVPLDCSDTYQTCAPKGCSGTTIIGCPSDCDQVTDAKVFGYQVYSDDSSICRAAMQSWLVSSKGGNVTVIQLPGRSYYSEANFNSVASSSKGTASGSFTFDFSGKAFKCEPGWISSGYSCYFVVAKTPNTSRSYTDAVSACASMNSHLVVISDSYEQTFVQSQVGSITGNVWIGLTDQGETYVWADGKGISYSNWMKGEPNDYRGTENCVEMYPSNTGENSGRWNDNKCASKNGYICEKIGVNESLPYVPPTDGGLACPPGWVTFNTSCYFVVPASASSQQIDLWTWVQARDQCRSMGSKSDLLSIHTLAEFQFVRDWLHKADWRRLWVGLNDRDNEGVYVWSDGSPVHEDGLNWRPNQPDNYKGTENCVELFTNNGRLNDRVCDGVLKLAFACKTPRGSKASNGTSHHIGGGSGGGLSGGAIAGIIIGLLLAIALGVVAFFVLRRRMGGGGGAYNLMSKTKFDTDDGDDDGDDVGMLGAGDDDDDEPPVDP